MNLVSVITVVYNDKEGFERTLKSVLSQTYEEMEYIVIDGESTDGTVDVIKNNQGEIKKWISEPDKGIYDAMNKGIKLANGEWLCFMNAGDVFSDKDVLKNILSASIPETVNFLYSDNYSIRKDGSRIRRKLDFRSGNLIHQSIIYRRKLHIEHGLYIVTKQIIISDALFFARISEDEVKKVDTVISVYQGGGISQQGNWAEKQSYCLDVVFRRRSFEGMIMSYCWKRIKSILSVETKDRIKVLYNRLSGNDKN